MAALPFPQKYPQNNTIILVSVVKCQLSLALPASPDTLHLVKIHAHTSPLSKAQFSPAAGMEIESSNFTCTHTFDEFNTFEKTINNRAMKFKIGDCVKVKKGVMVEGISCDIAGWQGRVSEIADENLLGIRWDSITVRSQPEDYIIQTYRMTGTEDFNLFYLGEEDIEAANPRDSAADVAAAIQEIEDKYYWKAFDDGDGFGEFIQEVLDNDEYEEDVDKWGDYIESNVKFPFKARVFESSANYGKIRVGDEVVVKGIEEVDIDYGILVKVRKRLVSAVLPLCDLEFIEGDADSSMPVAAYVEWFANR